MVLFVLITTKSGDVKMTQHKVSIHGRRTNWLVLKANSDFRVSLQAPEDKTSGDVDSPNCP